MKHRPTRGDPTGKTTTFSRPCPQEALTILTATSALALHPSTALIERAIQSLAFQCGVRDCRHLIVCDGYPTDGELSARYDSYKQRLRTLAAQGGFPTRAEIVELQSPSGLPGVILAGCSRIATPYLLVYEHDWEVIRRIDTPGILQTMSQHRGVCYVRLNKRRNREASLDFVLKPDVRKRPVTLTRTSSWSANPHFATMSYYRRMVLNKITSQPHGGALGFEDPLYKSLALEIRHFGFDRAQRRWGVFIYGGVGASPAIRHLDGRALSREHARTV